MDDVRLPAVSGTFYPANAQVLRKEIEGYLSKARPGSTPKGVMGLISPHAGFMYSGQTAAYGYKCLSGDSFDTVIIVAPSHRSFFVGVAADDRSLYRTPLGDIPVDVGLVAKLIESDNLIRPNPKVHEGEHSLEVQLPFLQYVIGSFKLVPLIMGTQDPDSCKRLAEVIYGCVRDGKEKVLIVGSTDLSHYYPYDHAVELDSVVMKHLERFDVEGMVKDQMVERYEACGAGPMVVAMMTCRSMGSNASKVLNYANSGDVSGDRSSVVGYISCIFFKEDR